MLIGLCGPAGCGKNSVADHLQARYGWIQFGFADPIYAAVSTITGIPVEKLRERSTKEKAIEWLGKSPRELLQTLGTEWGRDTISQDIWITIAMRQVDACQRYLRGAGGVALTDVRFANEVEAIKAAGGQIWRVDRRQRCLADDAAQHSSEAGIPDYLVDAVIDNTGTLDALHKRVDAAMKRLRGATIEV
jgi:hypothetical protein